jgi:hypothetical protein
MSLWIDVEQNRPIEVEVIVGEVVRLAKEVGVDVPRLEIVEALMRGLGTKGISKLIPGEYSKRAGYTPSESPDCDILTLVT